MSNQNGKPLSAKELLRAEVAGLRQSLERGAQVYADVVKQSAFLNRCLATILHTEGSIELSHEDTQAAHDSSWLRVRSEILEHDDGQPNSVRLSLVPVTPEETLQRKLAEGKAKGPKLLGPDGSPI